MEITSVRWWARKPFGLVFLVLLLGFLFGVALLLGGDNVAGAAPTCTITWTGGGSSTSWFTAANWDQNRLPATSDNVCIPATNPAITVAFDQNQTAQILTLQSAQALAVSAGQLAVTDTTQTSTISNGVTLSGGSLGGAGNVVVAGPVSWSGGGKNGTGTLTANGGMTISGTATKFIDDGTVTNPAGQTAVINGTGPIAMGGGTFANAGTVDDQADLNFIAHPSGGGFLFPCNPTGSGTISNSGTFIKSGGAGTTLLCPLVAFSNSGTVKVTSGTLSLQGGGASTGPFTVAGGSTLDFGAGSYLLDAGSSVTGAGTGSFSGATVTFTSGATYTTGATSISGGSVTFNGPASTGSYTQTGGTLDIATGTFPVSNTLTLSGGSLGGAGNVAVAGPVHWSGGTKDGAGTLTANSGMTISGTDPKAIDGGGVTNPAGQTAVIDGTGSISIRDGGTFTNAGTVDDQADLVINAHPGSGLFFACSANGGTIDNTGVFTKSGGAGTTVIACPTLAFNNSGTVNVTSGTLSLQGGGASTGPFTVAGGSTLDFGAGGYGVGTYALDAGSSVTGAGTGSFSGATVTFTSGATYTTGTTSVSGGSITFNGPASTGSYTQTGGALDINLGGSASCTAFGQVKVSGAATLDGALHVGLADGCSPGPGQSFKIMTYASHSGEFAVVSTPIVGGQAMPVTYSATDITVGSIAAPGKIVVKKITDPASDTTTQFTFNPSYGPSFQLTGGGSNDSGPLAPGSAYTVTESATAGWTLASATCDNGNNPASGITVTAGQTVTCTFTNTERGQAKVIKTVNGSSLSGTPYSFTFQLRQGASPTAAGTILETGTANAAGNGVSTFATLLVPGQTYQLCEQMQPGWMTTLGPPLYSVYNPSGDNSVVCTDFTVTAGQTRVFSIDNKPPPGGMALSIGYWKNWSSCTGGNQAPVLDQTLAKLASAGTPETLGKLILNPATLGAKTTCQDAVDILSKTTITGTKMASDPLFNMASQLLGADLNVAAGAGQCSASATAINSAHALLAKYGFDGKSSSSQLKVTAADAAAANNLATTLASYNNDKLC